MGHLSLPGLRNADGSDPESLRGREPFLPAEIGDLRFEMGPSAGRLRTSGMRWFFLTVVWLWRRGGADFRRCE